MRADIRAERADIDRVVEGKTLCDALAATIHGLADAPALHWQGADGLASLTWRAYGERVRDCALGLRAVGLRQQDFVAIVASNRPEHTVADLGAVHLGAVPVSVYTTCSPEQLAYVLGHCEASVAVVENEEHLERLESVRPQLPRLHTVVMIDAPSASHDGVVSWAELLAAGQDPIDGDAEFEAAWRAVTPDDLATVVYTSGTTGPPKGVSITHGNVLWTMESINRSVALSPEDAVISYLPLAHALERWWSHWNSVIHGVRVTFCSDRTQLVPTMRQTRPSWFIGVPRVWEKLSAGILAGVAAEPDPARRGAVEAAIAVGREYVERQQAGAVDEDLQKRWEALEPVRRAVIGGVGLDQCRLAISGGAPVARDVVVFFNALGLPLAEGWGMTELTGTGTRIGPQGVRPGTTGVPLPGVEMRLAEDGELLVRSGSLMAGYYKDPAATAETVDQDGWLHTGDLAEITDDEHVRIIGRKKELIITAGGKNVSPGNIESLLAEHPLVGNACVIGDGRPYLSALIVLDPETAGGAPADDPDVVSQVEGAVAKANSRLSRPEQVRAFRILPEPWTVASGELTPTLKMKRDVVLARYRDTIEAMYERSPATPETPPRTP